MLGWVKMSLSGCVCQTTRDTGGFQVRMFGGGGFGGFGGAQGRTLVESPARYT